MLSGEVLRNDHRGHERDVAKDTVADLHILQRHDGESPLRRGVAACNPVRPSGCPLPG